MMPKINDKVWVMPNVYKKKKCKHCKIEHKIKISKPQRCTIIKISTFESEYSISKFYVLMAKDGTILDGSFGMRSIAKTKKGILKRNNEGYDIKDIEDGKIDYGWRI